MRINRDIKGIQMIKGKVKLFLCADNVIYIKLTMTSQDNLGFYSKVIAYRSMNKIHSFLTYKNAIEYLNFSSGISTEN